MKSVNNVCVLFEEVNRKLHAKNTVVQLLAICTDPERHNPQRNMRTDGWTDGRTD